MTEDQVGLLVGGLLLAAASYGVYAVTAAAAAGRIRANGAVGLRTPATLRSETAWQTAHQVALPVVRPFCLLAAGGAVVGALTGTWPPVGLTLVLGSAALLGVGTVVGAVKGHRAAKAA